MTTFLRLRLSLVLLWPVAVSASTLTFGNAVEQISTFEWCLVLFLSTLAGTSSLLIRISNDVNADPPRPLRHPVVLGCAHMAGSWLVGVMAFFGATKFGFEGLSTGLLIAAMSFSGAAGCDLISRAILTGVKFKLRLVSPGEPPAPPSNSGTPS
jgi:hypothetical protein